MVGLNEATSKQASNTAAALASSTCLWTVVSWLTYPFMFIIKNVSWTGPVAMIFEQIGKNVADTVAKVMWATAAGKSRIKEEEGAGSVGLGLSCRSRGTSLWVNPPMRSRAPSTMRYRSGSQQRGLPRSSSGSRFRT